jgi:hypothetical protein
MCFRVVKNLLEELYSSWLIEMIWLPVLHAVRPPRRLSLIPAIVRIVALLFGLDFLDPRLCNSPTIGLLQL